MLKLKLSAALSSLSYAIVVLLSAVVIKESLAWQKVTAVVLIVLGIICSTLDSRAKGNVL